MGSGRVVLRLRARVQYRSIGSFARHYARHVVAPHHGCLYFAPSLPPGGVSRLPPRNDRRRVLLVTRLEAIRHARGGVSADHFHRATLCMPHQGEDTPDFTPSKVPPKQVRTRQTQRQARVRCLELTDGGGSKHASHDILSRPCTARAIEGPPPPCRACRGFPHLHLHVRALCVALLCCRFLRPTPATKASRLSYPASVLESYPPARDSPGNPT